MTRKNVSGQDQASQERDSPGSGPARLVPKVTFGLGVAVLTGLSVVSVAAGPGVLGAGPAVTTVALGAAINAARSPEDMTTCCITRG
jgi:hypothetical protein